jgi:MFS family permease
MLGWTVSAADRALTGPVVTWMIDNKVAFLAGASKPYALAGLIGGLFFAGYMLTQFPGGYLGDRYGHRTIIGVSLVWAGIATLLSGVVGGLAAFIAVRVITGLGEGAFYSNDRSWSPRRHRWSAAASAWASSSPGWRWASRSRPSSRRTSSGSAATSSARTTHGGWRS